MKKWFKNLNIVEAGLLGIYLSMIPACYVIVKVSESEVPMNEIGYMFMMWSMLAALPMTLMLFNHLAKKEGE